MEETVGFEPTDRLPRLFLSKEVLSATQPRLQSEALYIAVNLILQGLFKF